MGALTVSREPLSVVRFTSHAARTRNTELLTIDIGNSLIHLGLFQGDSLKKTKNFSTQSAQRVIKKKLNEITSFQRFTVNGSRSTVKGCAIASVVPKLLPIFIKIVKCQFSITPLIVSSKINTGLKINYRPMSSLGADRIANSVAAYRLYKRDAIIIGFGTATTFDVVTKEGEYLGGLIAPGIISSADSLYHKTAQLPKLNTFSIPARCLGTNTRAGLVSGVFHIFRGGVREIVKQISQETGRRFFLIATGGLAKKFAPHFNIKTIDQYLTLKGIKEIFYQIKP